MKFDNITPEEKEKLIIVAYLSCYLANSKVKQDRHLRLLAIDIVGHLRNVYANALLSELFKGKSSISRNSKKNYVYCKAVLDSTQPVCIAHLQSSAKHPRIASFRAELLYLFPEMEDMDKQTPLNLNFTTSGKLLNSFPYTVWLEDPHSSAELQLDIPFNIEKLALTMLADIEYDELDAKAFSIDHKGVLDIRDGQNVKPSFKFYAKQERKPEVHKT